MSGYIIASLFTRQHLTGIPANADIWRESHRRLRSRTRRIMLSPGKRLRSIDCGLAVGRQVRQLDARPCTIAFFGILNLNCRFERFCFHPLQFHLSK